MHWQSLKQLCHSFALPQLIFYIKRTELDGVKNRELEKRLKEPSPTAICQKAISMSLHAEEEEEENEILVMTLIKV